MYAIRRIKRALNAWGWSNEEVGMAADAMEYLVSVLGVASGFVDDDPVH